MGAFDTVPNIVLPDPDKPDEAAAFRKKYKWEPHEQVILRGTYSTAMQEEVENASSGIKGSGRQTGIDARIGSARRKLLEVMILDWTFASGGRKVEVTPQAIGRLPSNYRDPILEKIDEIAVGMSDEEQEDFLASANGHSLGSSTEMKRSQRPS